MPAQLQYSGAEPRQTVPGIRSFWPSSGSLNAGNRPVIVLGALRLVAVWHDHAHLRSSDDMVTTGEKTLAAQRHLVECRICNPVRREENARLERRRAVAWAACAIFPAPQAVHCFS